MKIERSTEKQAVIPSQRCCNRHLNDENSQAGVFLKTETTQKAMKLADREPGYCAKRYKWRLLLTAVSPC